MSYPNQVSQDLLAEAANAGLNDIEIGRWRRDLNSATIDLCGCKAAAKAAALSSIVAAGLIYGFVETRFVTAIAAAAAVTISITIIAKFLGYRAAERRLAGLHNSLRTRISLNADQS